MIYQATRKENKSEILKRFGPSWYDFAESALYHSLTAQPTEATEVLFIGENAYKAIDKDFSIVLFTDTPTYALPGFGIERAKTLFVFDAEHYHRAKTDIEEKNLKCPIIKILPPHFFGRSYEPIARTVPTYGIVQPDYDTEAHFARTYFKLCELYQAPFRPPFSLHFFVFSDELKEALLTTKFGMGRSVPRLPVHVINPAGLFPSGLFGDLDSTPNGLIFTDQSNHFSPMQFMMNSKIKHIHFGDFISEICIGNLDQANARLHNCVNQLEMQSNPKVKK